jgi:chorismate mutase
VFTATPDLTSEFPAAAARRVGISDVPLLCATEIAVVGAIGRCIRVLMHLYTKREAAELKHVYLRDARGLRTDLE